METFIGLELGREYLYLIINKGLIDAVASVKRHIENEAKREATIPVSKSNSNTSKESTKSVNIYIY
jgi:hypothetical protein